jgi:hypothetical protein
MFRFAVGFLAPATAGVLTAAQGLPGGKRG